MILPYNEWVRAEAVDGKKWSGHSTACPICGMQSREIGMLHHILEQHGVNWSPCPCGNHTQGMVFCHLAEYDDPAQHIRDMAVEVALRRMA